jgi:hypothetical protein
MERATLIACGALAAIALACAGDKNFAPPIRREIALVEAPEDHTLWFRKNHGQAASSPDAKCASCHVGLSGSAVNNCIECHSTERPRDHHLRFRGPEHGRLASRDPERCRNCHEQEVCSSCHAIPPPNHSPLQLFIGRHGAVAGKNPRSCLTCHSFESTCVQCHSLDVAPRRGFP